MVECQSSNQLQALYGEMYLSLYTNCCLLAQRSCLYQLLYQQHRRNIFCYYSTLQNVQICCKSNISYLTFLLQKTSGRQEAELVCQKNSNPNLLIDWIGSVHALRLMMSEWQMWKHYHGGLILLFSLVVVVPVKAIDRIGRRSILGMDCCNKSIKFQQQTKAHCKTLQQELGLNSCVQGLQDGKLHI